MIDTILHEMYSYVHDVVSSVEDNFDNCEDFEDHITDSIVRNTRQNITTLNKYLGDEPMKICFKSHEIK